MEHLRIAEGGEGLPEELLDAPRGLALPTRDSPTEVPQPVECGTYERPGWGACVSWQDRASISADERHVAKDVYFYPFQSVCAGTCHRSQLGPQLQPHHGQYL